MERPAEQRQGPLHHANLDRRRPSDTEMLEMCANAGLTHVFLGIETPNEVSLREAKKRQNLKRNLLDEIQRIVNYGISVDCGRRVRQ